MKIKITDSTGHSFEVETSYNSIFDVLEKIESVEKYITFSLYNPMHDHEYDYAVNKDQIVRVEEINDNQKAFWKDNKNKTHTF